MYSVKSETITVAVGGADYTTIFKDIANKAVKTPLATTYLVILSPVRRILRETKGDT